MTIPGNFKKQSDGAEEDGLGGLLGWSSSGNKISPSPTKSNQDQYSSAPQEADFAQALDTTPSYSSPAAPPHYPTPTALDIATGEAGAVTQMQPPPDVGDNDARTKRFQTIVFFVIVLAFALYFLFG